MNFSSSSIHRNKGSNNTKQLFRDRERKKRRKIAFTMTEKGRITAAEKKFKDNINIFSVVILHEMSQGKLIFAVVCWENNGHLIVDYCGKCWFGISLFERCNSKYVSSLKKNEILPAGMIWFVCKWLSVNVPDRWYSAW